MRGLAGFALRGVLPAWLALGATLAFLLAARASGAAPVVAGDEHAAAALRALARQNVWSLLFLSAPLLWLRAAQLGTPAAGAWLAPTRAAPLARSLGLCAGCALATAVLVLLAGAMAELAAGDAPTAWRRERTLASPSALLPDGAPAVRWSLPDLAPGTRLRVGTTVAIGSGPATSARLRARTASDVVEVEARVAGRTVLELEPRGTGPLELELERIDAGALLALLPGTEVLVPVASERLASLALAGRVALALLAGAVLALGLARGLRPALAAALVLALALFVCTRAAAWPWLPGASLGAAWSDLAHGLVPAGVPLAELAGAALVCSLGVALHAHGGRR